ncbi:hypothetical protein [Ekhidna sp.]|uniref:hypothetical protein n=1 Tax=Ekhidna sp. TaxID=2608089 RepID=UPI003299D9A3
MKILLLSVCVTLVSFSATSQKFVPTKDTEQGLAELKEILDQGQVLRAVLGVASFQMLFSSSPDPGKLYSVATTDWEEVGKMLQRAGSLDKIAARKLCDQYIMVHEGIVNNQAGVKRRDYQNVKFWKNMRTKFQ